MNIFCDAKGNIFYADAEKIYQGAVGVNEICFIGEFPSSAQVLMAYKLPNGDYKAPIMLTRVHGFNEVQLSNGGKWTMWKGRVGAVPKIEDDKYVTDENGNIVYDLDHTITEYSGTASVRFFVYGSNGRVVTEEVNFNIEKGLPVYLDIAELNQTSDAERLLEQILAAVENVYEQDNTLEEKVDNLYNEVRTDINVLYSDTNDNRQGIVNTNDRLAELETKVDDAVLNAFNGIEGYRLIEDITLAEDVLKITINKDNNGNPLKLKSVFVFFLGEYASTATSLNAITLSINGGLAYGMYYFVSVTTDKTSIHWIDFKREKSLPLENRYMWLSKFPVKPLVGLNQDKKLQGLYEANVALMSDTVFNQEKNATELLYGTEGKNAVAMKAGSRIIVWGVDDD